MSASLPTFKSSNSREPFCRLIAWSTFEVATMSTKHPLQISGNTYMKSLFLHMNFQHLLHRLLLCGKKHTTCSRTVFSAKPVHMAGPSACTASSQFLESYHVTEASVDLMLLTIDCKTHNDFMIPFQCFYIGAPPSFDSHLTKTFRNHHQKPQPEFQERESLTKQLHMQLRKC